MISDCATIISKFMNLKGCGSSSHVMSQCAVLLSGTTPEKLCKHTKLRYGTRVLLLYLYCQSFVLVH